MNTRAILLVLTLVGVSLTAGRSCAQTYGQAPRPGEPGPDAPKNVAFDQKLGNRVSLDSVFQDHDGKPVTLRDVSGGKPALLVLYYNRCPQLCNEVIQNLILTMNDIRRIDPAFTAGESFSVVFVSIDPRETPSACKKRRELFLAEYDGRPADAPGVVFLTASHGQGTDLTDAERKIHRLAAAVGFRYELRFRNRDYFFDPDTAKWATSDGTSELPPEPKNYDYGHASGVVVLAPDGTVSKYLLGIRFGSRDLRLALVDASGGKIGTLSDAVALACFAYDPKTGLYKPTMRLVAAAFTPVMLLVVYIAYRAVRQARREVPLLPGTAGPHCPRAVRQLTTGPNTRAGVTDRVLHQ